MSGTGVIRIFGTRTVRPWTAPIVPDALRAAIAQLRRQDVDVPLERSIERRFVSKSAAESRRFDLPSRLDEARGSRHSNRVEMAMERSPDYLLEHGIQVGAARAQRGGDLGAGEWLAPLIIDEQESPARQGQPRGLTGIRECGQRVMDMRAKCVKENVPWNWRCREVA
jgi:hypothetical protein